MSQDILEQLEAEMATKTTTPSSNNEAKSIKAKFQQLLYSNRLIAGEREAKKEVFKALKDEHGIPPKVARAVEKLIDNGSISEFNEHMSAIEQLYEKVRT